MTLSILMLYYRYKIRKRGIVMAYSNIKTTLASDIRNVWNTVTDLSDWSWRSDLDRIEVLSDTQFVEYTKDGYATTFTVTKKERYKRWEFDVENENIKGHWTGIFYDHRGRTTIDFTEKVTVKKFSLRPFAGRYLRKQQLSYVSDLKKKTETYVEKDN